MTRLTSFGFMQKILIRAYIERIVGFPYRVSMFEVLRGDDVEAG